MTRQTLQPGKTVPGEDVLRSSIDEIREVGVHVLGRRLYEARLCWETTDRIPSLAPAPGHRADLLLLHTPLDSALTDPHRDAVRLTICNGRIVHDSPPA